LVIRILPLECLNNLIPTAGLFLITNPTTFQDG
jgi:hypothetical protein